VQRRAAGGPTAGLTVSDPRRPEDSIPFGVRVGAAWAWRLLLIAAAVSAAAYAAAALRLLVIPAVAAVFLTVLLEPVKQRLVRAGMAAAAAALTALVAFVLVFGGVFVLLVPPVVDELDTLGRDVEDGARRVLEWVSEGPLNADDTQVQAAFDGAIDRLQENVGAVGSGVLAGAALVVVPTLIAGVYGMNFDHMPELHWTFGYAWALLLMVGSSIGLLWFFKRSGWL